MTSSTSISPLRNDICFCFEHLYHLFPWICRNRKGLTDLMTLAKSSVLEDVIFRKKSRASSMSACGCLAGCLFLLRSELCSSLAAAQMAEEKEKGGWGKKGRQWILGPDWAECSPAIPRPCTKAKGPEHKISWLCPRGSDNPSWVHSAPPRLLIHNPCFCSGVPNSQPDVWLALAHWTHPLIVKLSLNCQVLVSTSP